MGCSASTRTSMSSPYGPSAKYNAKMGNSSICMDKGVVIRVVVVCKSVCVSEFRSTNAKIAKCAGANEKVLGTFRSCGEQKEIHTKVLRQVPFVSYVFFVSRSRCSNYTVGVADVLLDSADVVVVVVGENRTKTAECRSHTMAQQQHCHNAHSENVQHSIRQQFPGQQVRVLIHRVHRIHELPVRLSGAVMQQRNWGGGSCVREGAFSGCGGIVRILYVSS
jgi:hypothetical protein